MFRFYHPRKILSVHHNRRKALRVASDDLAEALFTLATLSPLEEMESLEGASLVTLATLVRV
jgi:hypothetical protein